MSESPFHRRLPEIHRIPLDELILDPDFRHDEQYLKLMRKAEAGSTPVAFTRIRTDLVTSGFYLREGDATVHVSNLKMKDAMLVEAEIRRGARFPISLYWSPLCPHDSKLVCPDDEATLAAYRSLGILYAPALLYSPAPVRREEGAIWSRNSSGTRIYDRALAPEIENYSATAGVDNAPHAEALAILCASCASARAAILRFHIESDKAVHYHQMLHALLLRHERALTTVSDLLTAGRAEHACAVVRMTYEAFLGFYVDWLAPMFIGPRLQLASHLGARRGARLTAVEKAEDRETRRNLGGFDEFLTSVIDKARISPLGEHFYDLAYPTLSWITHQAYGVLEPEALTFDNGAPDDDPELVKSLVTWLNLITTALVVRTLNEIGEMTAPQTGGALECV